MRVRWRRGPGVSLEEDARGDGEELHPALEYTTARTVETVFVGVFPGSQVSRTWKFASMMNGCGNSLAGESRLAVSFIHCCFLTERIS